jgi:hypothetical protein
VAHLAVEIETTNIPIYKNFVKFDKNWPKYSWIFTMNIDESGNEYSGKFSWIFTQKYHNSNEYEFWFLQFELNWIFEKSQKTQFKLNRFESIRINSNQMQFGWDLEEFTIWWSKFSESSNLWWMTVTGMNGFRDVTKTFNESFVQAFFYLSLF